VEAAFSAREVIEQLDVAEWSIGVLSTPYKCPPASSEPALLMHEHLTSWACVIVPRSRWVVDLALPIPPCADASEALVTTFTQRGIEWHPRREVPALGPSA
jgi:sulfide:quinone oxidoreductase